MEKQSKVLRWCSLILGVLVLICGVSLLFTPMEAYVMIAWIIPIAILFHGIGCMMNYFGAIKEKDVSGWVLADGILSAIIGVWLLFRPGAVAISLPAVFGFWVLFAGVLRIIGAFTVKGKLKGWGWLIVWGIIGIISGLFLLNHPVFSGAVMTYLVVWGFIFMGIQNIFAFFISKPETAEKANA